MTRPATDDPADDATIGRKSTLFCLECDHASPVDGDWVCRPSGDAVAYVCPVCSTTITERPRRTDRSPWWDLVHHSVDVWRVAVTASVSGVTALWRIRPRTGSSR
ncbi:hypothetical protein [Halopiger goleimassiliensis]|uniref:hypothetical protein n=1 Tax=Halopiger goleimassiliensis TaxID=1293048 RepID=UPI0009DB8CFC|nr:hypothetical protein [Halopiger goleimassiliensis]